MNVAAANRRTAIAASVVCVVLIVAIAVLSGNSANDTILRRPSTFFTDASGARAVYLVLQRVLPSVDQWRLPLAQLKPPSGSGAATLIVFGPNTIGRGEADALDRWIASGGQLIVAASADWNIVKRAGTGRDEGFLDRHQVHAGAAIEGSALATASIKRVGRGRIVYVGDNYAFSNSTLLASNNAVWLIERCSEWGGGVLFDEYHNGFGEQRGLLTLIAMFAVTPWGLVCTQLALGGIVYILGCKRRFGKPIEELPPERTNALETVQALGGLFETSQANVLSARVMHQYLNGRVSLILGYRIDLMNESSRGRLAGPLDIGKSELDSYAEEAGRAMSARKLSDVELMGFARKATAVARSFSHGVERIRRSAAARRS